MVTRETVSLQRLVLLWAGCIALCSLSLGENSFAIPVLLLASVSICIPVICWRRDVQVWWVYAAVVAVGALGLVFGQYWVFATSRIDSAWLPLVVLVYAAIGCTAGLCQKGQRWSYLAFLLVHLVLVGVSIHGVPVISDVRALVDGGADALLRGVHPYGITVPGVYEPHLDWIYGPGVLVDGRITYGYPYLPVPLLFVLPAFVLGDIRLALILAMVLTSLLVRRMATDQVGRLCAVLVLVMPVSWAMQLSFWVEPVLLLWIALMAFAMTRGRPGAPTAFGLLLASKQFAIVLLPLLWPLFRYGGRRALLVALGIPAVMCSVFLIWDPAAFYHSAVDFHLRQPYRPDTVTLTPTLERILGSHPSWLDGPYGFALGAGVSLLIASRCRPGPTTMAAAAGLSLAVSVLFSKQGHANYWGLIGGALLVAVAAHRPALSEPGSGAAQSEPKPESSAYAR